MAQNKANNWLSKQYTTTKMLLASTVMQRHDATSRTQRGLEFLLMLGIFLPMAVHSVISQYLFFPAIIYLYTLLLAFGRDRKEASPRMPRTLLTIAYGIFIFLSFYLTWKFLGLDHLGSVSSVVALWVLAPLSFFFNQFKSESLRRFRRLWLICAFSSIPFALYEFLNETRIFESRIHDNALRASFGQDHPIILGMIFAGSIPLLLGFRFLPKLVGTMALLCGTFLTGSSGPFAVALLMTVIVLILQQPGSRSWFMPVVALLGAVVVFTIIAYLALTQWSVTLNDSDNDSYSNGYRLALYSFVPQILRDAPLGYGFAGLPQGQYFIESQLFGSVDIAQTIDSEFVLLLTKFGIGGILIAGTCVVLAISVMRWNRIVGLVYLSFLMNGFSVALHVWPGIAITLSFLFGVSIWIVKKHISFGESKSRIHAANHSKGVDSRTHQT